MHTRVASLRLWRRFAMARQAAQQQMSSATSSTQAPMTMPPMMRPCLDEVSLLVGTSFVGSPDAGAWASLFVGASRAAAGASAAALRGARLTLGLLPGLRLAGLPVESSSSLLKRGGGGGGSGLGLGGGGGDGRGDGSSGDGSGGDAVGLGCGDGGALRCERVGGGGSSATGLLWASSDSGDAGVVSCCALLPLRPLRGGAGSAGVLSVAGGCGASCVLAAALPDPLLLPEGWARSDLASPCI